MKTQGIRNTRSKDAIRKAVLCLAKNKSIQKISITEICREASIHRSTFYKYYGCQSDVIKDIMNELIFHTADHVMNCIRKESSIHSALCNALEYIKGNQAQISWLLEQSDYSLFQDIKIQLPDFKTEMVLSFPSSMSHNEKQAYASFVQYGIFHLLLEWVLAGCVTSPQEEVDLIFSILSKTLDALK